MLGFGLLNSNAADSKWLTDLEKAKELARRENKAVLLDFTGSDWCPPCIQLKRQVFSKPHFQEYADEKLVLVEIDFPLRKELPKEQVAANQKLQNQFKVESYPTIILLDASGKELGRMEGYAGDTSASFIKKVEGMLAKKSS